MVYKNSSNYSVLKYVTAVCFIVNCPLGSAACKARTVNCSLGFAASLCEELSIVNWRSLSSPMDP